MLAIFFFSEEFANITENSKLNPPNFKISFKVSKKVRLTRCRTEYFPRVKASGFCIVRSPLVSFDRQVNRRDALRHTQTNSTRHSRTYLSAVSFSARSHGGRGSRSERSYFVIVVVIDGDDDAAGVPFGGMRHTCLSVICLPGYRAPWILATRNRSVSRRNSPQGRRRFVTRAASEPSRAARLHEDRCTRGLR